MISTVRVQVLPHHLQRVLELDETAQRQVLGLHRHDHAGRGDERVDRQQAERRRRVDQDVVVAILDRRRAPSGARARGRSGSTAPVGAGEVDRRDGDVDLARARSPASIGSRCTSTSNIERSIVSGFSPCDIVRLPCGSRSMQSTRSPCSRNATPRLSVVVVFATPPFWFASAITCVGAGPLSRARWRIERAGQKTCDCHLRAPFASRARVPARPAEVDFAVFVPVCGSVDTGRLRPHLLRFRDGRRERRRRGTGAPVALQPGPRLRLADELPQLAEERRRRRPVALERPIRSSRSSTAAASRPASRSRSSPVQPAGASGSHPRSLPATLPLDFGARAGRPLLLPPSSCPRR